jgi:hypothetical protein
VIFIQARPSDRDAGGSCAVGMSEPQNIVARGVNSTHNMLYNMLYNTPVT